VDAFVHLGSLISGQDLKKLEEVVVRVFSEFDPSLELPPEERFYAGLSGKKLKHSEWLRKGLATTLLLITEFHDEAGLHTPGTTPQGFVNQLVAKLPGLHSDYRAIASLYGVLPIIAEAAPRPLLQALDRLILGDGRRIRPIYENMLVGVNVMEVAIYCRVSTSKQENENQLAQLREFVSKQDAWEIVQEYVDTITGSGKKARPQFDKMMLAASQHKFDLLLFWSMDRFTREGARKTLAYLTQLDAWNVAWRSNQEPYFDSCGPFKDAVISIMSTLAAMERSKISERTKAGLQRVRKAGTIVGRPRCATGGILSSNTSQLPSNLARFPTICPGRS
jgi:DNA invertase Pin-like site-specific DNA recombinase